MSGSLSTSVSHNYPLVHDLSPSILIYCTFFPPQLTFSVLTLNVLPSLLNYSLLALNLILYFVLFISQTIARSMGTYMQLAGDPKDYLQ